jgi:hypothetical protein
MKIRFGFFSFDFMNQRMSGGAPCDGVGGSNPGLTLWSIGPISFWHPGIKACFACACPRGGGVLATLLFSRCGSSCLGAFKPPWEVRSDLAIEREKYMITPGEGLGRASFYSPRGTLGVSWVRLTRNNLGGPTRLPAPAGIFWSVVQKTIIPTLGMYKYWELWVIHLMWDRRRWLGQGWCTSSIEVQYARSETLARRLHSTQSRLLTSQQKNYFG